jgi:hypothetical protein
MTTGHIPSDIVDARPADGNSERRFDAASVGDANVATFLRNVVFVAVNWNLRRSVADVVKVSTQKKRFWNVTDASNE